jgi:putative flavoprotein involved in K+ transport
MIRRRLASSLPRRYQGRDIEWWLDAIGALDQRYDEVEDLEHARRSPSPQLIGGCESVHLDSLQNLGVDIMGRLAAIQDGEARRLGECELFS